MTRKMNYTLWTVQWILALLFLFTGGMKLVLPVAELTKMSPLPGWLIRFVGVCEVAGAFGLILPGLFRIRQELTPLAAACLTVIMIGAIAVTIPTMGVASAALPFVTGLLTMFVARGRRAAAQGRRSDQCFSLSQSY
jgi:hypothetical protein